jgi:hypothetical protein
VVDDKIEVPAYKHQKVDNGSETSHGLRKAD